MRLPDKIIVHCPTQEEYDILMAKLEGLRFAWAGMGVKPTAHNEWPKYKDQMCINVSELNLCLGELQFYKEHNIYKN